MIGIAGSAFTVRSVLVPVPPDLVSGIQQLRRSAGPTVAAFVSPGYRSYLSMEQARALVAELAGIGAVLAAAAIRAMVDENDRDPWLFLEPVAEEVPLGTDGRS